MSGRKIDDRVPPGGRHSYHWFFIPEDGPTPTDPDSIQHDAFCERSEFRQSSRFDMCLGDKVGWHIVGMGNEVDVHSISFESQVFTVNGMT
ncbi:hypothetical protein CEXT_687221 [Caerostris extrusa]|uniref:Uncharacterized protein n=1 Tax=Caerostris extrusa TaxID=172846 RepID=A0AAV4TE05_CAEEX|nr:hypothetical protein CEXT_687221 [Caerostris extrusa]